MQFGEQKPKRAPTTGEKHGDFEGKKEESAVSYVTEENTGAGRGRVRFVLRGLA